MVPGPVQYKRNVTLWLLVVLILLCWPAAIVYYFTREKVPIQELQPYASAPYGPPASVGAPMASGRFCSACGSQNLASSTFCSRCGKALS